MRLYDFEGSGNCYKVRLLLALLGVGYERVPVNSVTGETLTPEFRRLNPRGQIPVLIDGAQAAVHLDIDVRDLDCDFYVFTGHNLARRYGGEQWLPQDALGLARVMQWLAVSENELLYGLARARVVLRFGRPFNLDEAQTLGRAGLAVLEQHLEQRHWLAAEQPTIADIACFPYVDLAPEGGLPLDGYPAIRGWLERIRALPGYVPMSVA